MVRKSKNNRRTRTRVRSRRVTVSRTSVLDKKAMDYRRLLADPCGGPLVSAVGLGPTTGLLSRQKYVVPVEFLNVASDAASPSGDFVAVLSLVNGVLRISSNASGAPGTGYLVSTDLKTGILQSGVCHSYRPVAGCIRWVPSGNISTRSGTVSTGYVGDKVDCVATTAKDIYEHMTLCQKMESNTGTGEMIEARWIPSSPDDLDFKSRNITYSFDNGNVIMACRGIDKTTSANPNYTYANGFFEVTAIWEWIPTPYSGIVSTVQAGSTNNLNQILASLGDLTRFVVDSSYARRFAGLAMATAMNTFFGGRSVSSFTGPGLLTG